MSDGTESLRTIAHMVHEMESSRTVVAEESLLSMSLGKHVGLHKISASAALPLVLERLREGGDALDTLDANYVRNEYQIYGNAGKLKVSA